MKKKLILDIIMTILMLLLMKIGILDLKLHELAGVITFILFFLHKILNIKIIIQTIKKWKNTPNIIRVGFILDILILITFILLIISSIIISNNIFKFLNITSTTLWSDLHHFFAYLLFLLISIHLGFHYNNIWLFFKKIFKIKDNKLFKIFYILLSIIFIVFGIKVIINNNFYKYLLKPFGYKEKEIVEEIEPTESITLEEYLKDKHCDGCSRHCPLTNLRCPTGQYYLQEAKDEYNRLYTVTTKENVKINVNLNTIDYLIVMSAIVASTHYILKVRKLK